MTMSENVQVTAATRAEIEKQGYDHLCEVMVHAAMWRTGNHLWPPGWPR